MHLFNLTQKPSTRDSRKELRKLLILFSKENKEALKVLRQGLLIEITDPIFD